MKMWGIPAEQCFYSFISCLIFHVFFCLLLKSFRYDKLYFVINKIDSVLECGKTLNGTFFELGLTLGKNLNEIPSIPEKKVLAIGCPLQQRLNIFRVKYNQLKDQHAKSKKKQQNKKEPAEDDDENESSGDEDDDFETSKELLLNKSLGIDVKKLAVQDLKEIENIFEILRDDMLSIITNSICNIYLKIEEKNQASNYIKRFSFFFVLFLTLDCLFLQIFSIWRGFPKELELAKKIRDDIVHKKINVPENDDQEDYVM